MSKPPALADTLEVWAQSDPFRQDIATVIAAIAEGCRRIADLIAIEPYANVPCSQSFTDTQPPETPSLGVRAKAILDETLDEAPLAAVAFEGIDGITVVQAQAPLCAAFNPMVGGAEVDTSPAGTMFSVLPAVIEDGQSDIQSFLQPGTRLVAAGYVIYGPRVSLVLTVGSGTQIFILNRQTGTFGLACAKHQIPLSRPSLSIDSSTSELWDDPIKRYVTDWLELHAASLDARFHFQTGTSLIANSHRILTGGGVQLYPGEVVTTGIACGQNLVFDANPIARVMEDAGGAASSGISRITTIIPSAMDQETSLMFGIKDEVASIEQYVRSSKGRSPLFSDRGLFLV